MRTVGCQGRGAIALLVILAARTAAASPPFVLDDADTLAIGHVELDAGALGTFGSSQETGELPALEADLGLAPGVEADVTTGASLDGSNGRGWRVGMAAVELAFKIRLADQAGAPGWPSIAVEPTLVVPTATMARGLGTGSVQLALPIWVSREAGRWTLFGGGGPTLVFMAGRPLDIVAGLGAVRDVGATWHVGGELYGTASIGQTPSAAVAFDLDVIRDVSAELHAFAALGHASGDRSGETSLVLGLQITP